MTQIQFSANFIDPARASDISSLVTTAPLPFGFQLPATSDASVQGGAVLGYVLSGRGKPTDLGQALSSFAGLHMLSVNDHSAEGRRWPSS